MFSHVMVGSNDVDRSKQFYDSLFEKEGRADDKGRVAYRRNGSVEEAVKIDHPYYLTEPVMELFLQRAGLAIRAIDYAPDHLHVGFICDKSKPDPEASPCPEDVRDFFREIRAVHNRVPLS